MVGSADSKAIGASCDNSNEAALPATRAPENEARADVPSDQAMIDASPVGWTVVGDRTTAVVVRRPVGSAEGWLVSAVDATRPTLRDSQVEFAPTSDDYAGDEPLVLDVEVVVVDHPPAELGVGELAGGDGPYERVLGQPEHAYTRQLLEAA